MNANKTPRLLVADDDLGVIAAYRHVLEKQAATRTAPNGEHFAALEKDLFGKRGHADAAPWRVHFVDQGEDAVAAIETSIRENDPFSAVFLDIRMPPGIDGHETAKLIRVIDPNVHIVIVSGYSDYDLDEIEDVCGGPEQMTFLPKPVWPDELRAIAARVVAERNRSIAAEANGRLG